MRKAAPSLMITLAISLIAASPAQAEIAWQTNLRAAHAQAQREGKLLLLHFYTDNCTWCEKLEQGAFQQPAVGETISSSFVAVKVDAEKSDKLAEMFKVTKFPTDVVVTTDGKTLSHSVSPQSPDRYVAMLQGAAAAVSQATQPPTSAIAAGPKPETPAAAAAQTPTTDTVAGSASTPNSGLTLPMSGFGPTTQAQLTGSRGPSMQMPTSDSNPSPTDSSALDAADIAANSISGNVSDSPDLAGTVTQRPDSRQDSPKQPELAMQGFCPVTVIREDKWVEGKPEHGVIHLGKLYLFSSEENMQTFLSDPVPFTPVLNEIDAVVFFEERRIVQGKREWGLKDPIYNRMFFFADEASMNHFYENYERYTKSAIEVMDKAVKDANPGS